MEAVYVGHDSLVEACDGVRKGPKIGASIEADRLSQWVHPKALGIVVSPTEDDGKGGVLCIPIWIGTPFVGTCGCPRAGRLGGGDGDGPASRGLSWSWGRGQSWWWEKGSRKCQKRNKKGEELTVHGNEVEEVVQAIQNQPKKKGKGKGS